MKNAILISALVLFILCLSPTTGSRIKIVNNGYEDILISLPSNAAPKDRTKIVTSLQDLFQKSSSILSFSTKGRAQFRSVIFLVPRIWGDIKTWLPNKDNTTSFDDAGAVFNRADSDVVVTYSNTDDFPYTLHQGGCGRLALRIYLPSTFLLSENLKHKDVKFTRLWSEFRYGVFSEGGFEDDPMYPTSYKVPGETENRTTGCRTELISQCDEHEKCEGGLIMSSLMDQHLQADTAIHFCEGYLGLGPRHNPSAPSKHNLLCNEEGTWFTVLRSLDFQHGRNAAPKYATNPKVTFRFIREVLAPKIIVAIDVSSRMNKEHRYTLTQNAFSQLVTSVLPDDSELSLVTFGGSGNTTLVTFVLQLVDEETRITYLESQPLPEEPSDEADTCLDYVLHDIVEFVDNENDSFTSAPTVILVTAQYHLDATRYDEIQQVLQKSEIRLHAMSFLDDYHNESHRQPSLYQLCSETGNKFVNLEGDSFSNLYNGFAESVVGPKTNVLIFQKFLTTLDEENIRLPFVLDKSVSRSLQVSISGPLFNTSPLEYDYTTLVGPGGIKIKPQKRELVPSWNFHLRNPEAGNYYLKTRRKRGQTSPVLVTVYGTPTEIEDPITVNMWVEIPEYKVSPPPVQVFVEVKKGRYPIKNATVIAYVHHPGNDGISKFLLFDEGLGNVDITREDGVYSHYFTNFTSLGFYNVYVKVTGDFEDYSVILKGPPSECCGSVFTWTTQSSTGQFQRKAGPVSFEVTTILEDDLYPPAKVTDLRIAKEFDQIIALQWTAVGDDFDSGVASTYELKLFNDRSVIRNRFSNSGLELYTERIAPMAEYGMTLYHLFQIPNSLERGAYYFGIRALDDAENAGEPSNAVAVWLETMKNSSSIDCNDVPTAEKYNSASNHAPLAYFIVFMAILFYQ